MKPGITLIEVAISILLGSMLASVLFISFSQLQLASRITESFIEVDMRSTVVMHTLSQDIQGAFVPELALIKTPTGKQAAQVAGKDKKLPTPLDMATVFMVKHKEKNLDSVTCITNNPITVYDTVKPRIARVVYRLVADKEREGTFRLMRQEAQDLNLKAFEKTGVDAIRSYELARNIKSCTCKCLLLEYPEPPKEEQKKEQQEIIPTVRTLNNWVYDPKKAKEEKMPLLPYALTFNCIFWDDQHRREWPVEFTIPVATFEPFGKKKNKKPKKNNPKPLPGMAKREKAPGKLGVLKKKTVKVQEIKLPKNVAKFFAKKGKA